MCIGEKVLAGEQIHFNYRQFTNVSINANLHIRNIPDLQWMFATSGEPLDKNLVLTGEGDVSPFPYKHFFGTTSAIEGPDRNLTSVLEGWLGLKKYVISMHGRRG
jgi:hypothetical protein